MSQKVDKKQSRFSTRQKLILIGMLVLVIGVVAILAAFSVRALAPRPTLTAPTPTPTVTATPMLASSVQLSPQEEVEPGELIVVTGEGWQSGDELAVYLVAPSGDQQFVAPATVAEDGHFLAPFFFPTGSPWSDATSVWVRVSSTTTGDEVSVTLQVAFVEVTPSPTPTPVETATATAVPTAVPVETATPTPSALPTATSTRTPVVQPTVTPTPIIWAWRGEYFPRVDLVGAPTLVRNDANVDFDWGRYAPAAGIPADGFSVRWSRSLWLDGGRYRFHAVVDDGARLYVDGGLVIDAWHDGAQREVTGDRQLSTGNHTLRVEYYERTGEALIHVWWERLVSYPDWKGEYWSNRKLDGKPALVRNDEEIDFNWGTGAPAAGLPADDFSARWRRDATFKAGVYRFYARADDGIRVYLDDKLIISQWRDNDGEEVYTVDRNLSGEHEVVVEYYERNGGARIEFWWKRLGDLPTPTPTKRPTATPTQKPTATPTLRPTATPTSTPEPTATSTPTAEPTATPTPTVEPTATPTPTAEPTATPTPTTEPTATPTPTTEPTTTTVRLNEIMPVPAQDGIIDELDEWIELYNGGTDAVDLSGWLLDDSEGGSEPYRIPAGTVIQSGAFLLFHGRETGLVLDDVGDDVRLMDLGGAVVDAVAFGQLAPNASYSRDEAGVWHADWPSSPGAPNRPPTLNPGTNWRSQ